MPAVLDDSGIREGIASTIADENVYHRCPLRARYDVPNDHRTVTVHYRKLARQGGWSQLPTLSDAIQDALGVNHHGSRLVDNWQLRITQAPDDIRQQRFINDSHLGVDYVFGDLCAFTGNEMQAVMSTSGSGPSVAIQDLAAPGGTDYLHGIAYWLVVGDHCYVVQHTRVRTKALEEYLTWLLRDATSTIAESVVLQSTFNTDDIGANVGDVSSIEIGGLAPETIRDEPRPHSEDAGQAPLGRIVERRRSLAERFAPLQVARQLLETAFGPIATERIIERMPTEAALQVRLLVSYVSKSREVDRTPLSELGVAVRNFDDGEVRIRAKNGIVTKSEARLHESLRFRRMRENGNLLDLDDVHTKLLDLHMRLLEEGRISD